MIRRASACRRGATEWEGFEPSRRVDPAHAISSRAPSAARTPLHGVPSIARSHARNARRGFSRCERFSDPEGTCHARVTSRSFALAPSASRSRLKLRRGTEAFRGNGTSAEWTKRRAFGHFVFRACAGTRRLGRDPRAGRGEFSAASAFPQRGRLARRWSLLLDSLSHRALSRKRTKLRRGVGSPSGPGHAGEAEKATESRSVLFVFRLSDGRG